MTKSHRMPNLIACLLLGFVLLVAAHQAAAQLVWFENPTYFEAGSDPEQQATIYVFEATYYNINPGCPLPPERFRPPTPVPWDPPGDDMHVRKAVDTDNEVHIAWMRKLADPERWEIFYAELDWDGSLLVGPTQISDADSVDSMYPAIALDSDDDAHVVWVDHRYASWEIYYSKIQNDSGIDLTGLDFRLSDADLFDSGRAVMDPIDDGEEATYIEHPDIAVDHQDTVHVVWSDARDDADWEVYWQKQTNAAIPVVLKNDVRVSDDDSLSSQCPAVATGGSGESVHVVWQDARDLADWEVYYQVHAHHGLVLISDTRRSGPDDGFNSAMPDIDVEDMVPGDDHSHIVFMDQRDEDPGHHGDGTHIPGHWEIYSTILEFDGTATYWGVPKRQSDMYGGTSFGDYSGPPDSHSMYPQVVVEDDYDQGYTHIAWHDQRQEHWDIYHTDVHNWCNNPETDTRITEDENADMYPSIALDDPHLPFGRDPDIKWQSNRLGPWRIFNAASEGDEWVKFSIEGRDPAIYHMHPDPHDLDPTDGIRYSVGLPLTWGSYDFRMTAQDCDGETAETPLMSVSLPVSVEDPAPASVSLAQNGPNPFAESTAIRYALPGETDVRLTIYNMAGRVVRTLVDRRESAGHKVVHWDGRNEQGVEVSAGVYLCRLEAAGVTQTRKMIRVR